MEMVTSGFGVICGLQLRITLIFEPYQMARPDGMAILLPRTVFLIFNFLGIIVAKCVRVQYVCKFRLYFEMQLWPSGIVLQCAQR